MESCETRLRRIEDHLAINHLISRYGPLADSGEAELAASLWEPSGVYGIDLGAFDGHAGIVGFLQSPLAVGLRESGSSHVLAPAEVVIEGDRAVATNYSLTIEHAEGQFRVFRSVAARREFARTTDGEWLVRRRLNQALKGSARARELLAAADDSTSFEYREPA
ncbi:hypothetical protein GCM10022381_30020 [Leifsonia kafniensis]|uniref:SnoaL-like domain-containing protein n=1 Tax=Leifsonia kafniensis TaxID=475957 RepID=A0ABP7KSG2_9MICO